MSAEKYIRVAAKIISVFAEEQLTFSEAAEILSKVEGTMKKTCVIEKADYNEAVYNSLSMSTGR